MLGRVIRQGNVANSVEFVASYKVYTVFQVPDCFKSQFSNVVYLRLCLLV